METYPRSLLTRIMRHIDDKAYIIITGARQTGKTTLLYQIRNLLQQQNEDVYYLTLEDPTVLRRLNDHPGNIFEFVLQNPDRRSVLLIDEIQYLQNPSNFLKLLYDIHNQQLKIIVTGSSAFYVDVKFGDSLAGRKVLFELYPLDFDEFLKFRLKDETLATELGRIRSDARYLSARRTELESLFNEYLTWGGYPAVVLAREPEEKVALLKELSGSFLKRDITESNIHNHDKFYHLLLILAQQTGSLVNKNELSRLLNLSVTAIENYLLVLRKCYHLGLVRPFARNIRKEITRMPKYYFNDLGLRNVLLNQFSSLTQRTDKGVVLENYTYIRLRTLYDTDQIRFWRTADGNEIDFIVSQSPDHGLAIEIKSDIQRFQASKYAKFTENYTNFPLHCRSIHTGDNQTDLLAL